MSSGSGKNESETSAGGSLYGGYDITARFNPSMAVIIVVLLSAFFFMGFLSIYVRRCAGDNEEEEPSNTNSRRSRRPRATSATTQGLDKSVINRFPIVTYSVKQAMKRGEKSMDCAVCLCEFEEDEVLRMLPRCSHWFHRECIDMWLFSHSTCPLCRRTVLTPENNNSPCMLHSSQAQPDNQSSLVIIVGNEHTPPPPPQQQEVHVTASPSLSPTNSPVLGGETVSFGRSHSTGHSLIRLAGDPLHPSYLYVSTVGRSNHGDVGFFPMPLVHSNKAGLHRCNSGGIGIPGFDSKPERDDESEQRQSLWMYPSSTADYLCQDLPPHSEGRLNVHRGRQNTLLSPHSPYLVRALARRRDGVNLNLNNGSTSSCDTSSPGSYLQNLRRNGLSWFKS